MNNSSSRRPPRRTGTTPGDVVTGGGAPWYRRWWALLLVFPAILLGLAGLLLFFFVFSNVPLPDDIQIQGTGENTEPFKKIVGPGTRKFKQSGVSEQRFMIGTWADICSTNRTQQILNES